MTDLQELERELGDRLRVTMREVIRVGDVGAPTMGPHHRGTPQLAPAVATSTATPLAPRNRSIARVAAAVLLLGGTAATAVVLSHDSRVTNVNAPDPSVATALDDTAPASVVPPAPGSTSAADGATGGGAADTTGSTIDVAADVGALLLPTVLPTGYSVADVSVGQRNASTRPITRYLRSANDGSPGAMVELSSHVLTENEELPDGSRRVHGQPADSFDSGQSWVVRWSEAGRLVTVYGTALSSEETLTLAEGSEIDPTSGTVTLPDSARGSFVLAVGPAPSADRLDTSIELLPDDRHAGGWVSVGMTPNSDRFTLAAVELRLVTGGFATAEHTTIRGEDALVATTAPNEFGAINLVTWIEDGVVINISGRVTSTELVDLADGLTPATVADARALRATVDERALALPSLGAATLPNGMEVSAHTAGRGSADFLCLTEPIRRCEPNVSESSLVGDVQRFAALTFVVDGDRWLVGWAEGEHEPHLSSEAVVGDPVVDVVVTGGATYFAAPVGDDPNLRVVLDPQGTPSFGASTVFGTELV